VGTGSRQHRYRAIPNHLVCLRYRASLVCLHLQLVQRCRRVPVCHQSHDRLADRSCLVHLVDPLVLSVRWCHVREYHHVRVRRECRLGRLILVVQHHQLHRLGLVGLVSRVAVMRRVGHSRLVVPSSHRGLSGRVVRLGISCIRIVVAGMGLHRPIRCCRFLSGPLVRVIHRVRYRRAVPVGRAGM